MVLLILDNPFKIVWLDWDFNNDFILSVVNLYCTSNKSPSGSLSEPESSFWFFY